MIVGFPYLVIGACTCYKTFNFVGLILMVNLVLKAITSKGKDFVSSLGTKSKSIPLLSCAIIFYRVSADTYCLLIFNSLTNKF